MHEKRLSRALAAVLLACATAVPAAAAKHSPVPVLTAAPRAPGFICAPPRTLLNLAVPGHPFDIAQTPDGCTLFVALGAAGGDARRGIAVFRRVARGYAYLRGLDTGGTTTSLSIASDGSELAASILDRGVVVYDVPRIIRNEPITIVSELVDPPARDAGATIFSLDASRLYVIDRVRSQLLAIDLAAARTGHHDVYGHPIPLDLNPQRLALSPDGTRLYVAVDTRSPGKGIPAPCRTLADPANGNFQPEGVLAVLDIAHADRDGVAPVLARSAAGCSPSDLSVSPDGSVVWIAALRSKQIVAFNTARLAGDPDHAVIARTDLGFAADRVRALDNGNLLIASGYDKPGDLRHALAIVTRATSLGTSTAKARYAIGRFPRGLLAYANGNGAIVAIYGGLSVQFLPGQYLRDAVEPPIARSRRHGFPRQR